MDNVTEEILIANYFDDGIYDVFCDLFKEGIYPIVYSYIDGITEGMKVFLNKKATRGLIK